MQIEMLKAKIHRATVTQAELNYVGSITIDSDLLKASGICEYEKSTSSTSTTASDLRHIPLPVKPAAVSFVSTALPLAALVRATK